jgi:O-antigen/teichoic acid export membrane protein
VSAVEVEHSHADTEWERSKVGDRLIAFSALLPATTHGSVVMAVDDSVWPYLAQRFPNAIVLVGRHAQTPVQSDAQRIVWDGTHSPLAAGTASLVVADARLVSAEALGPTLAPDGVLAVVGADGEFVIYPSMAHPEHVWRSGWPLPAKPGLVTQLRRSAGLTLSRWRSIPRLSFAGAPFRSLAELIISDVARRLRTPCGLVGVETAGQTILRVRSADGDLAVRLSLSAAAPLIDPARRVAGEVAAARPLVLPELAAGRTAGFDWTATPWLPRGRRPVSDLWFGQRRRRRVAHRLVQALEQHRTGIAQPGWARRWCADVATIPAPVRDHLAALLQPLETAVVTGWCHGDPWPANVVLDRRNAAVIDWENAVPDAPLGLDWLLIAGLRRVTAGHGTMADACVRMIDGRLSIAHEVGGRRFSDWQLEQRVALVVAAFVHYLRNRSLHDMGGGPLHDELEVLFAALVTPAQPTQKAGAGRAARGALWLGLSAAVVKGAQTLVLLVVAALLAPSALGLLALGALITNIAQTLSDMGASMGLVYWRGDPTRAARTALTVSATTSSLIAAGIWALAPWLADVLHAGADGGWVIRGLIVVLPCYGIAGVSQELLRRDLAFGRRIVPDITAALIGAGVSIALAFAGHGLAGVVAGQIAQGVLTMVLTWVVGRVVWPAWHRDDAAVLLRYGGHLTAAGVLGLGLLNVDYVLVSRVLGSTALGQYSLAFRLAYLPYLNVAFVIAGAAFPYLCRLSGADVGRAADRIINAAMTLLLPVCVGIGLFADQLALLGAKWAPAVPALRWLALYAALLSLAQFAYTALNAVGQPRATMLLRLLHLVVLVAVLSALVHHGVEAVAVGQVIAALVAALSGLWLARRHVPGLLMQRLGAGLVPALAGSACMTVVALTVHRLLPATTVSAAGLAWVGLLALSAYAAPVFLLGRADLGRTMRTLKERA